MQIAKTINNSKVTEQELLDFLKAVDKDFPIPLSQKNQLEVLAKKFYDKADIFAVRIDNQLAGAMIAYVTNGYSDVAYATVLAVRKEFRGKGIAGQVLNEFIQTAKNFGKYKAVELYTSPTNVGAIKLYEKTGFIKYEIKDEPRPNDLHLIYYL